MSKENVALFTQAIGRNEELRAQVSAVGSVDDCVRVAHREGLEFTPEEFRSVIEDALGRKATMDGALSEWMKATSELSEKILEQVTGGSQTYTVNRFGA